MNSESFMERRTYELSPAGGIGVFQINRNIDCQQRDWHMQKHRNSMPS